MQTIQMQNVNQGSDVNCNKEKKQKKSITASVAVTEDADKEAGLRGDYCNILLLLLLYFLQGIPLGIVEAIPLILVNKKASYGDQALFSLVHWPFSLKLLWAPLVDSFYSNRFGRRKSWFVPVQYGIGFFMIALSYSVDFVIGNADEDGNPTDPNVNLLTIGFFLLVFLTASQDIAVDGWALTMLSKRNVEYAPSCNSVGQTVGVLCGHTLFLALESSTFCNRWLRSTPSDEGLVSLGGFLLFWGVIFIVSTTFVMFFKHETDYLAETGETELGCVETYKMLWRILSLPTVRWLAVVLVTLKIGFAPADGIAELKLVEYGIKRENLGIIRLPLMPLQLILPWLITRFAIKKPMYAFFYSYPLRLLTSAGYAGLVWWTWGLPREEDAGFPAYFYMCLIIGFACHLFTSYCTGMTIWAFMARVSDPLIGGTYMTLLTTLSNLGSSWSKTTALYFVKFLDFEWCPNDGYICNPHKAHSKPRSHNSYQVHSNITTGTSHERTVTRNTPYEFQSSDDSSNFFVDGYFVETAICLFIGLIWLRLFVKRLKWLDKAPKSQWRCT